MDGKHISNTRNVHLALLFVQVTFGGFNVVGKIALAAMPPLAVASLRVLFAGPLLLGLSLLRHRAMPPLREMPRLALLGFFGVFINQVLFIIGLSYTTAINSAILMPSIPVFTAAVAIALRVERPTWAKSLGIALAVLGALVLLDITNFSFSGDVALGNVLILLNCLSYSLFLVLARPVLLRLPPLTVTAWTFLFGGVGVLFFSIPDLLHTPFATLDTSVWLALGYILLLPTLVNYLLNIWAIRHSSPTTVATYTTLQPVIATILAILILDEMFGMRELLGFVLIIAGLLWTVRRGNAARP